MPKRVVSWTRWVGIWLLALFVALCGTGSALAGELSDRLNTFPDWQSPPKGTVAKGELIYPDWFEGSWRATSTLREAVAPFAPDLVTPGFEQNQASLGEPVVFTVRFTHDVMQPPVKGAQGITGFQSRPIGDGIVADRAYNTKSLGDATIGDGFVESVTLDPNDFSRLITQFQNGQQLMSESRERSLEETPSEFISSEMFLQTFRTSSQIYLNQVENTTDYRLVNPNRIEANQITAIYLSPKDPDFFKARSHPVALYRYDLLLEHL